jgi:exonuclease III
MDRIGVGRIPNPRNANIINNWIADGNCFDPFRSLYPDQREISYIPFRIARGGMVYGKTRLDFFLVSEDIINLVRKVKYEDRMSFDFDHKMVSLWLGKNQTVNKIKIFNR